ncbi:MAG TPA: Na/Pi cotransporter family protein [Anaerolineales bacterium]|nr:Na/Pi cotransporter family protein [Anaerolineales bacterium]
MFGFLEILGGLALFLYGIRMLNAGMEKLTGEQIQKWLERMTRGRFRSALFGTIATALIHSSGLLMVTMIGLINANLMTVEQTIGVIIGQEIGTTLTAQIVAFNIGNFNMVFVVLGVIIFEFFQHRDWKKYGEISFGIGIVFLGMTLMSGALKELMGIPWVASSLTAMGQYPLAAVLAGLLMTATVQSSTAVTSVTVAMGISHVITLDGAVGIILGANIGSCITGFIASFQLSRAARQASIAQILINVFGVLLFLPFISPYANLVSHTSSDLPRQIANAHTIFNITVSALMFPFVRQIAWVAEKFVPPEKKPEKEKLTAYIDDMQYSVPAVALTEAARELARLGSIAAHMLEESCQALVSKNPEAANHVLEQEDNVVDPVFKTLVDFVDRLIREDLSITQQKRCFQMKNLLIDIERVADMAEDIAQYAMERIKADVYFSPEAIAELEQLGQHVFCTFSSAVEAFQCSDKLLARKVCEMESEFDKLYWQTRQRHIERLEEGVCSPEANVIFTETLRVLERISDHADNLGVSVMRA